MTRRELTEPELLNVLNRQLAAHDTCANCRFTSVSRLEGPDETGSNWSHVNLRCSGQPADVCRPAADHVISTAKEKYNLR